MPRSPRKPLPAALMGGEPFTVAPGRLVGLGQGRLRGTDLNRPFHGIRVPRATLAAQLSLPDLVAIGDDLVLERVFADPWDDRPWASLRQLQERVEIFRGRGMLAAGRAVGLIRPGAESRPETLLRLAIMDAGLPEPEVNVDIQDARGRFIGRGDLVYRRWRVIVEYDGDQHRTSTAQFDRDVRRLDDLAAHGWRVVRIVGRSFFGDRAACLQRIARALTEAGWHA